VGFAQIAQRFMKELNSLPERVSEVLVQMAETLKLLLQSEGDYFEGDKSY
jgi:hypothetical protein